MSSSSAQGSQRARLPRIPSALLRVLLPYAERDEVLDDVTAEYRTRRMSMGRWAAWVWVWRQVLASTPALARRGWWRGWSGFETGSQGMKPGGAMFEEMAMDLRYALRRLRVRRTYSVLTVLTLALGVAGTAAVYSIVERLLLQPLPYAMEEELVAFWGEGGWSEEGFAYVRPQMDGFQSAAAWRHFDVTLMRGDSPARLVRGVTATAELFDVLGASPADGPGFQPGDDRMGAEPVAVLSHSLWQELGGDPAVVGQRVELSGVTRTVVGVMPEGFWFPDPTVQVWLAEELDPENATGNWGLIGRMAGGTGLEGMSGPLSRLSAMLSERFDYPEGWDLSKNSELTPLRKRLLGSVEPALLALLGAMVVILLIACVNVAALMLGEVDSRRPELAVRSALGAVRQRLLRQLLSESLLIGALAGLVGAGLAVLGFRMLVTALPLGALAENTSVDWTLFGAAIAIALLAATAVALLPGLSVARHGVQQRLAEARTAGVSGRGGRLENTLVVAQVALVLLLASGSALLIRSVGMLRAIETGVDPAGVVVVDVLIPESTPPDLFPQAMRELVSALQAVPGMESAAATQRLPLRGSGHNWGIGVEGRPELDNTTTAFRIVSPDYFQTMGIEVTSGRGLLESDRAPGPEGAVVINRALAEKYFPGTDPIGQRIAFMGSRWDRIVGVVENVSEAALTDVGVPARYMLYEQVPLMLTVQTLVARTRDGQNPAGILDDARRAVQRTAPGVAVQEVTTMENVVDRAIGPARQVMALLSLLGTVALALGVIGVYGAVSHFVARRKRDWGIRIALGMRPQRVVRSIVGRGGALVGAGILVGLATFLALARVLSSFLYQVGPSDPISLLGATGVLVGAGLLAAFVPALRAGRIDPARVLKEQG